jgi:hypothetical protein
MLSYSAEGVLDALQLGLLGRALDPETREYYIRMLEKEELGLSQIVEKILEGRERQRPYFTARQAIDAIHFAALGRLPDDSVRVELEERIGADSRTDVLSNVAAAFYNSAEHQNRLLPANVADRVLVDHSPNGEFIAMLRLFLGANGRGTVVEVGLPTPSASYSIDFLRLSGWRGIVIEPSSELCSAIEARFSGADFELIQTRVDARSAEPLEAAWQAAGGFGLVGLDQVGSSDVALASVLAGVDVPTDFEVLAVSKGVRTAEVVNDLIGTSEYRPALIIAELEPPLNWTELSQLGLSDRTAQNYGVGLSTEHSVFLVRR